MTHLATAWCRCLEKRNLFGLTLLFVGIVLLLSGIFLAFYWMQGLEQRDYTLKAGASLELSWYLEKGERTEGNFNVSRGNLETNMVIENPSGEVVESWSGKGEYNGGFMAQETGTYTLTIINLDNIHEQTIFLRFSSPFDVRISTWIGWVLMGLSTAFLLSGISKLQGY